MSAHLGSKVLLIGAVAQLLATMLVIRVRGVNRIAARTLSVGLYVIALCWLWTVTLGQDDPLCRLSRGLLLLSALGLFIAQELHDTGLEPRRRSRIIIRRLLQNTRWPSILEEYRYLPDVRKLYTLCRADPTLAFGLIRDPRAEVQVAGLCALLNRRHWRWNEGAHVFALAGKGARPEVKALVFEVLRSTNFVDILKPIGEALRDARPLVRESACEVLLSGGDARWVHIRSEVRNALIDANLKEDGPLLGSPGKLSPLAICDLTMWATEPASLAERSVSTLIGHYRAVLQQADSAGVAVAALGEAITDPGCPAILRIEYALLLRELRLLSADLHDRMTDPNQPSVVRLIAVESMLAADLRDSTALDVLRGLGRQSNCETALAVARILQRYCGMQFGVPDAAATPKQAQEAMKKVSRWASGQSTAADMIETPMPVALRGGSHETLALFDEEDALGGLPTSNFPASIPGMKRFDG